MFTEMCYTTQYSSLMGHNILLVLDVVSFPTVSTDSVDDVISTLRAAQLADITNWSCSGRLSNVTIHHWCLCRAGHAVCFGTDYFHCTRPLWNLRGTCRIKFERLPTLV